MIRQLTQKIVIDKRTEPCYDNTQVLSIVKGDSFFQADMAEWQTR